MREILFRGKSLKNKEWIYSMTMSKGLLKRKAGNIYLETERENVWEQVDPETVGQFTGLLDKNGNKIFEGDVFEIDNIQSFVVYSLDSFRFNSYMPYGLINNLFCASQKGVVVGNMTDNKLN